MAEQSPPGPHQLGRGVALGGHLEEPEQAAVQAGRRSCRRHGPPSTPRSRDAFNRRSAARAAMAGLVTFLFGGGGGAGGAAGISSLGSLGGSPQGKAIPYSYERLVQLYQELLVFRTSDLQSPDKGAKIVETVRAITEALVWGEQNDSRCFDFFCEKRILDSFIHVLRHADGSNMKPLKVQLMQTMSMLIQNLKKQQSLYFLFSNNQVNNLIRVSMDFHDEDILAYYMTLLKSLAMR